MCTMDNFSELERKLCTLLSEIRKYDDQMTKLREDIVDVDVFVTTGDKRREILEKILGLYSEATKIRGMLSSHRVAVVSLFAFKQL